jgi:hypothetical protein
MQAISIMLGKSLRVPTHVVGTKQSPSSVNPCFKLYPALRGMKFMKHRQLISVVLMIVLLSTVSVVAQENTPWVSLFNGTDLTGWKVVGGKGVAFVKDGEIVCRRTKGNGPPGEGL